MHHNTKHTLQVYLILYDWVSKSKILKNKAGMLDNQLIS